MYGTKEEFLEWDELMREVGVPRERYAKMRADKLARLIFNSTPEHLTLNEWRDLIDKSLNEFLDTKLKSF